MFSIFEILQSSQIWLFCSFSRLGGVFCNYFFRMVSAPFSFSAPLGYYNVHFVWYSNVQFSSVQLLSHVPPFQTPWIAACQASLSITNSRSLLKLMSIGPNIPGSYAIILFTASDLASVTSPIHNWALFLLWLHPFILSGVISPLNSSSILGTCRPGEFIFQCPIYLPFHTVHGVLKVRILKCLPFPSPVDHVLSELSTKTHLSWVALHGMA